MTQLIVSLYIVLESILVIAINGAAVDQSSIYKRSLSVSISASIAGSTIRLVGPSRFEGRVEVKVNGTWGTVCDNHWSMVNGYVVCRQLGFDGVNQVYHRAHYGQGTGPIFFSDMQCTSNEKILSQCPGIHDPSQITCHHSEDAGVRCQPPAPKTGTSCSHSDFTCSTSKMCIPRDWICDGHQDCSDGSDEKHVLCLPLHRCGIQEVEPTTRRVVGGEDARVGTWPWMASLKVLMASHLSVSSDITSAHVCGGTLIHRYWVLAAAHCFDHFKASSNNFQIVLGDYTHHATEHTEQTINVSHVYIHAQYDRLTHANDLALIKLRHPADMRSGHANIACLPTMGTPPGQQGDGCYVTGFGETRGTGRSGVLQEAMVPITNTAVCNHWYNNTLQSGMMCAGYQFGAIDACKGDSGGPLSCKRNGRWYVDGIVSWGNGCAEMQHPGIYMNVSYYMPWISRVMNLQDVPVLTSNVFANVDSAMLVG